MVDGVSVGRRARALVDPELAKLVNTSWYNKSGDLFLPLFPLLYLNAN